jgi:hypothetical protein
MLARKRLPEKYFGIPLNRHLLMVAVLIASQAEPGVPCLMLRGPDVLSMVPRRPLLDDMSVNGELHGS